ncbi:MAG TPA: elongation factor Ts [Clostridiales bacterium]|jgi:elongation factor Ts|nr:elongation factor Ts [Clostridiales bacterium]
MANITAQAVQSLRAKTGIGMMDCKRALVEANGNEEEAIKLLREKGLAVAAKKSSRIAAEGIVDIMTTEDNKCAAMIEVNIETDFAAKNETFGAFVKDLLHVILQHRPADLNALLALPFNADMTVDAAVKDKIFTIGENLSIRRFVIIEGELATYIHGKGTIGVIVKMADSSVASNPAFAEAAKNVALQIAAASPAVPTYLDQSHVPASVLDSEKEIITAQIKSNEANAKKPANIIEKMVVGKLGKYYEQYCLLQQAYVKEDGMTVEQYLGSLSKELGDSVSVSSFVRYEKGEGLEKKEDDFAAEVERLTKGE